MKSRIEKYVIQNTFLRSKTALIISSTSSISLGIAGALAQQGAHIVLNGFGDANEIATLQAALMKSCD